MTIYNSLVIVMIPIVTNSLIFGTITFAFVIKFSHLCICDENYDNDNFDN